MLLPHLRPGVRLKFPLSMNFGGGRENVAECSRGVETVAVTMTSSTNKGSATTFKWLPHVPGGVNYASGAGEIVSGIFTGCAMSAYAFQGQRRVAHVHTGNDGAKCCKTYFRQLMNGVGYTPRGHFKPYDGARDLQRATEITRESPQLNCSVLGIIDGANRCYSVFLKKMGRCDFVVMAVVERTAGLGVP